MAMGKKRSQPASSLRGCELQEEKGGANVCWASKTSPTGERLGQHTGKKERGRKRESWEIKRERGEERKRATDKGEGKKMGRE